MKTWYKNKILVAVAVLAVLLIGWFALFGNSDTAEPKAINEGSPALEQTDGGVRVVGEISCLPYRKSSDDQGCVKGIKDDEGRHFALNSVAIKGIENAMPMGTRVVAIGAYQPADTSNSESSVFVYDGVLVLSSLKKE